MAFIYICIENLKFFIGIRRDVNYCLSGDIKMVMNEVFLINEISNIRQSCDYNYYRLDIDHNKAISIPSTKPVAIPSN